MPTGQALVNLLASTGAISLTGGQKPTFKANFVLLRAAFQPEQAAMFKAIQTALKTGLAGAPTVTIPASMKQRTDTGNITLTPPGGGAAVTVPVIILLGTDGAGNGPPSWPTVPRKGETVILDERKRNGHILIAAAGNGGLRSDGGAATVVGGEENLIVALGGVGSLVGPGDSGLDGGTATSQGIGSGNDLYAEGGSGGAGAAGKTGTPAVSGDALNPPTRAGGGGTGSTGGVGGKAYVTGGDNSFGLAQGGTGGGGGPGGAGGAGAPPYVVLGYTVYAAVPAGATGRPGDGGDGGNYHISLGANSVTDPASSGGAGGPAAKTPPASPGAPGIKE